MGCDIHMVIEKRWGDNWVGLHGFEGRRVRIYADGKHVTGWARWTARERNYTLFGELASVRGHSSYTPRGVPEDASDLAKMLIKRWGSDGHSHSYMLMSEALPIFARHQFNRDGEVVAALVADGTTREELFHRLMEDEFGVELGDTTPDEYRLVFWFDN